MINEKNFNKFRNFAPFQAELLYIHAKEYSEAMDNKVGMDIDNNRHFNFKNLLNKYAIAEGHDSLYSDCKEIVAIWENQIAE